MGITAFPISSVIDVPTARILGRDDAGTGAAEALTNTEIFAILGTGTPSASTYLRGDGTWSTVSAGVGGSTGSVDNRILRADGTGGATLQTSLVSVNDAGQIQFHGSYSTFNVQLRNPDLGSSHGILLSGLGTVFVTNGGYLWRFEAGAGHLLGVSSSQIQFTSDTRLQRGDAAGILRQFSGTQPQKYELYNTYTSDTSFERLNIAWATNACTIEVTAGSAGGTLRGLRIGGAATSLLGFYGATPVDQPDTITDPTGGGTIDAEARTAINTIIDRLQELGLIT